MSLIPIEVPEIYKLTIFILAIIGWFTFIIILILIILNKNPIHPLYPDIYTKIDIKKREIYIKMSDEKIESTVSNTISNLSILGSIYGIMFALIISEKSSLIFISWSFLLWWC